MLGQGHEGFARLGVDSLGRQRGGIVRQSVEESGDVGRHDQLRVRQGVHQEHLASLREGDTKVEHRLLHVV